VGHGEGDSLIILFPSARREKAESRAAALADALARHNFPRRKRMTVGYGIGTYPSDAEDSQELLDFVDKASYEATRSRGEVEGLSQSLAL
jgi:GGDEF domain-containing protein